MRYFIQPATSVDVAFLAAVMGENRDDWAGDGVPVDRLLQTCACSTQIWAARDVEGTPTALWGVAPGSDDPDIGQLWMLACEAFDNDPEELQELSRLVFGEMLDQFLRLENFIDSRKVRAIAMLRSRASRSSRPPPTPLRMKPAFIWCGSIPTGCMPACARGSCPTDVFFSFASGSQVWVTCPLKKGSMHGPRSSFRSRIGGLAAGGRTRSFGQPCVGRRGGHAFPRQRF